MRVGLVLGAGGVVGASWLIGALEALESCTGWRAADAEVIVGTSAGSVIGTFAAAGIPPAYMAAYAGGDSLEGLDAPAGLDVDLATRDGGAGADYRLTRALPPIGPGSWRMAFSTLRKPFKHAPSALLTGWLPRGIISTEPISQIVDHFVDGEWVDHPNLWIAACDYVSGKRTIFGREGAPQAHVRDAVAASCAIPAFYHPVRIDGRRYIDGGVCSQSNADLVAGLGLDTVVILNPMSSQADIGARGPVGRLGAALRASAGRRLAHELRKLRTEGTEVLVLQPTADDLAVMGTNLMARGRRAEVTEQATTSVSRELNRLSGRVPRLTARRRPRRKAGARLRKAA